MRPAMKFELVATVDESVRTLIKSRGWQQADSIEISSDLDRNGDYINQLRRACLLAH